MGFWLGPSNSNPTLEMVLGFKFVLEICVLHIRMDCLGFESDSPDLKPKNWVTSLDLNSSMKACQYCGLFILYFFFFFCFKAMPRKRVVNKDIKQILLLSSDYFALSKKVPVSHFFTFWHKINRWRDGFIIFIIKPRSA